MKEDKLIEFENPARNKTLKALWAFYYGAMPNISKLISNEILIHLASLLNMMFFPPEFF